MFETMTWLNEPPAWNVSGGTLRAETAMRTDFFRRTFYGYENHNGHFLSTPVKGDFSARVLVSAAHEARFDQAGVMVLGDEKNWLKSGLEVTSGEVQVSTVCTRDFSDVSVTPIGGFTGELAMRVSRFGDAWTVHCRPDDGPWRLVRLGHLDLPETVDVGVMCCSPERAGLAATFRDFRVGPPLPRENLE